MYGLVYGSKGMEFEEFQECLNSTRCLWCFPQLVFISVAPLAPSMCACTLDSTDIHNHEIPTFLLMHIHKCTQLYTSHAHTIPMML